MELNNIGIADIAFNANNAIGTAYKCVMQVVSMLPNEQRNKFAYMTELEYWQKMINDSYLLVTECLKVEYPIKH